MPLILSSASVMVILGNLLSDSDAMAQAFCRRHPDVVVLKVDAEDVVVRGRAIHGHMRHGALGVAEQHLWTMRIEGGAINSPGRAVEVGQSFIAGEPGA